MLYQTTDYQAISEQLELAAGNILALINSLQLPNQDARHVGLTNMRISILSAGYKVTLLKNLKSGALPWETFGPYIGLIKVDGTSFAAGDFLTLGDLLDTCERITLQTLYQFQLENMLVNLCDALGLAMQPTFQKTIKALLLHLKIEPLFEKENALIVLALIRNTLHANGVHKKDSRTITLGAVQYVFEKDVAIRCSAWDYLAYALHYSIAGVTEILQHPLVKGLQAPIFENFAWDVETLPV